MDPTDLVAAAKATRPAASTPDITDQLRAQLECPVCACILFDPVAIIDCLHTFCGSCAKQWADSCNNGVVCPSCRNPAKKIAPDFKTASLVDMFLKSHPDDARTDEEIQELRAVYKPGSTVIKCPAREEYYDEDEDMEDDEEYDPPTWIKCPCCLPAATRIQDPNIRPELTGFTCPQSLEVDEQQGVRVTSTFYKGHFFCHGCSRSVPIIDPTVKDYQCAGCNALSCYSVYTAGCHAHRLTKLTEFTFGTPYSDSVDPLFQDFGLPERRLIESHLAQLNVEPKAILGLMLHRLKDGLGLVPAINAFAGLGDRTDPEKTWVDYSCGNQYVKGNLEKWWVTEKEGEGIYDARDKCWYGSECRTRNHNFHHRDKLNHMCTPVPPDQRGGGRRRQRRPDPVGSGDDDDGNMFGM